MERHKPQLMRNFMARGCEEVEVQPEWLEVRRAWMEKSGGWGGVEL